MFYPLIEKISTIQPYMAHLTALKVLSLKAKAIQKREIESNRPSFSNSFLNN